MGVLSNKITRDQLKAGDHIYSWRQAYFYSHHGIYVGEEKVIHFTKGLDKETVSSQYTFSSCPCKSFDDPCPRCGYYSRSHGVLCSCLDCFLSGGDIYLFKYAVDRVYFVVQARGGTCTLASSDPPESVLHRAYYLLENGFGDYNLFRNNCEDFAIYCKTELRVQTSAGRSGQAASFMAATSTIDSLSLQFSKLFRSGTRDTSIRGLGTLGCKMLYTYSSNRLASDIGVRRDVARVPVEKLIVRTRIEHKEKEALNNRTETRTTSMLASDIGDRHDVAKVPVEKPIVRNRIEPEEEEASNEMRTETRTTSMLTGTGKAGTLLNHTFSVKLDGKNYLLWKSLVSPIIRNHKLEGYILGTKPCPPEFIRSTPGAGTAEATTNFRVGRDPGYKQWVADDQMLRGWLLNSLTKDVEVQVIGLDTSREVWKALGDLWEAQNKEQASNILHLAIQTTKKGCRTIEEYLSIMKQLADNLATVGKAISLSDLISFVSAGLDAEYTPIVVQIKAKDAISWQELEATLLSFENNYKQQSQSSQYHHSGQTRSRAPNNCRNRGGGGWSRGRGGWNNFNYMGSFGSRNSSQSSAIPEMVGGKLS